MSLESVKAVVCRDSLLSDAAFVMDKYSTASCLRERRLEVRFEGESGFDAASGDEAGVTRGFYADVAEALLSCDHVARIHLVSTLPNEECMPKSYLHGKRCFQDPKEQEFHYGYLMWTQVIAPPFLVHAQIVPPHLGFFQDLSHASILKENVLWKSSN